MDYLALINNLEAKRYLKTSFIIRAFKAIDRADFVGKDLKKETFYDIALPIGYGQTISQPMTVALMLELLQPQPGEKIMDVGAGSGWTSALLAYCVGEKGKVFAVERIPELCKFGKKNISKYNFIAKGIAEFICADATEGLATKAPFDKIIAAASAKKIPSAWKSQLKVGGRMVLPVGESIWVVNKKTDKKFEQKEYPGFAFVPLVHNK